MDPTYPEAQDVHPEPTGRIPEGGSRPRRVRRPFSIGGLVGTAVAAVVLAASFIRLPFDTVSPGETRDVGPLVKISDQPTFAHRGQFLTTTVAVRTGVNPLQAALGWVDPTTDVLERRVVRGDLPEPAFDRLNQEAMADSKTAAQVVALRHLGFEDLGVGAEIVAVDRSYPAAPKIRPGDVIVSIDADAIVDSPSAVEAILSRRPDDEVTIGLQSAEGSSRREVVTLGRGPEDQARLGVQLRTKVSTPFPIEIASGDVSGPSAGLAYGLEILDRLTPGDLTGMSTVAVTGELFDDGTVGAVGGVRQKALGVARAGATVFVVPKDNAEEAREAAGSRLQVVAVENFDQALEGLSRLEGSNALALRAPGSDRNQG
ncbi:MAG: YlbL family protein [Acidimicrobiales bacterium]